jgi:hypothetical protein
MDGARFDRWTRHLLRSNLSRRHAIGRLGLPAAAGLGASLGLAPATGAQESGAGMCCLLFHDQTMELLVRTCTTDTSCPGALADGTWRGLAVETCDLCPSYPV